MNTVDEIKILELLKNSDGIHFREIHLDDVPYYAILAIARDLEKRECTTNTDGFLNITTKGVEYLNELLFSN